VVLLLELDRAQVLELLLEDPVPALLLFRSSGSNYCFREE